MSNLYPHEIVGHGKETQPQVGEHLFYLKGLGQAEIIKNQWFYFGFLIWPYDVNMSID